MKKSIQDSTEQLVGKVVFGYPSRGNAFYVIVRETPHTVLLKSIKAIQTLENPLILGQRGTEVPAPFDETFLRYDDSKVLIRAQKNEPDFPGDHLWFSYRSQAFFLWDGKPRSFDAMD